jgi:fructose-specific phosphotransferase system component IIB
MAITYKHQNNINIIVPHDIEISTNSLCNSQIIEIKIQIAILRIEIEIISIFANRKRVNHQSKSDNI